MSSLVCSSVFITGSNRGLGLGFVKHLLNLPVVPKHIFATCRSLKAESALQLRQLGEKHSNLHLMELDVSDFTSSQLHDVVEKVEALLEDSGLNLLINSAGIFLKEAFNDVTVESMKSTYEVNAIAPLMITKAFRPLLKRAALAKKSSSKPQAAIINISSIFGSFHHDCGPGNNFIPYLTSKAALNMVTKSLSIELFKDDILAVAVHPGWVKTDMGGQHAAITIDDSISSMLKLFESLDKSKSGCFLNYDGTSIPW